MRALKIVGGLLGVVVLAVVGFVLFVLLRAPPDYAAHPLPAIQASNDPAVVAAGEYVAHALAHCSACHGDPAFTLKHQLPQDLTDLRGGYVLHAGPFGTYYPANLTSDKETGLGAVDDAHVARAIRHGVARDGSYAPLMAFAVGDMADEDLTAVVSYLRTLPPKKNAVPRDEWGFLARALQNSFAPRVDPRLKYVAPGAEPDVARGEYVAKGPALCVGCHTPRDPMKGFAATGPLFSGEAMPEPDAFEDGFEFAMPNLTPDPETGHITSWSEDQFVARFKQGVMFKGSKMPWDNFAKMTESDVRSVYRYLRTLPPAKHVVGPTRRPVGWKP